MIATATVLCPDLSGNCLGRAYVLARLLQPRYEVRIVGPCSQPEIWLPLRDDRSVPLVPFPLPPHVAGGRAQRAEARETWRRVAAALSSELVVVSKPFWTSLHAAQAAARRGARVVVDIDDHEVGILRDQLAPLAPRAFLRTLVEFRRYHHREPWNVLLGAVALRRFPHRTVSSQALQRRYGGTVVTHARDGDMLRPDIISSEQARLRLGLPLDRPLIVFLGTLRRHKGLEVLIEAVASLDRSNATLVLAGADDAPYSLDVCQRATQRLGSRFLARGPTSFSDIAVWMAAADVIPILQQPSATTTSQLPAKLIDAMAMGRPIVVSAVPGLDGVVGNCALQVPLGDVDAARKALNELLCNRTLARWLGDKARQRFEQHYSFAAVRPILEGVILEVQAPRGTTAQL
jgi:glycosyltransferase involved in cell wall biosynthesis